MKIDNVDRRENLFVVDGEIVEGGATICNVKANITLLPSILSEAKCAAMTNHGQSNWIFPFSTELYNDIHYQTDRRSWKFS